MLQADDHREREAADGWLLLRLFRAQPVRPGVPPSRSSLTPDVLQLCLLAAAAALGHLSPSSGGQKRRISCTAVVNVLKFWNQTSVCFEQHTEKEKPAAPAGVAPPED